MSFIQLTQVQQLLAQTQINISFYSLKGHFAQHFPPDSDLHLCREMTTDTSFYTQLFLVPQMTFYHILFCDPE